MSAVNNDLINRFGIICISILHFAFLIAIAYDYDFNKLSILLIICSFVLITWAYIVAPSNQTKYHIRDLRSVLWIIVGGILTYTISIYTIAGPVISAGLIGVIASFLPRLREVKSIFFNADVAIYCGAFVGMSSALIMINVMQVCAASLVSGILYLLLNNILPGYGGKLGTIAFGGVIVIKLLSDGI